MAAWWDEIGAEKTASGWAEWRVSMKATLWVEKKAGLWAEAWAAQTAAKRDDSTAGEKDYPMAAGKAEKTVVAMVVAMA